WVTQLLVQPAGLSQRVKRAVAFAGQIADEAQLDQRSGLTRPVPEQTCGSNGGSVQGDCLGPGTFITQQGGQAGGQGDGALAPAMTGGLVQDGEQVGTVGPQPRPPRVRVRQRGCVGGRTATGCGPREARDELVGAARHVLVVVEQPAEGG